MSIKAVTMYRVMCDWPGCVASAQDDTESWAWAEEDQAIIDAQEGDWRTSINGKQHFCVDHPATWASDHENGEPYPEPPYLLIHDGDTDSHADDGSVTLVAS